MATPEEEDRLRRLLGLLGEPAPMSTSAESEQLFPIFAPPTPPATPVPRATTPKPPTPTAPTVVGGRDLDKALEAYGFGKPGTTTTPGAERDLDKALESYGFKKPTTTPPPVITPPAEPTATFIKPKELINAQKEALRSVATDPFGAADIPAQQAMLGATQDVFIFIGSVMLTAFSGIIIMGSNA